MNFTKEGFNYIFTHQGQEVYRSQKIALIVSPSTNGFFLQKMGPPESLIEWRSNILKTNPHLSQDYLYVESDEISPEELNKILSTTNYFPTKIISKVRNEMN